MRTSHFTPKLTLPLLFAIMVVCMGCPYESSFPLLGTRIKYDKNLTGTWHEGNIDLTISRIDDYRFSYLYNDHDPDYGAGEQRGTGYALTNNGATYLVAEFSSNGKNAYAVYKVLSIESNSLNVIPLDDDAVPVAESFTSAQDFTSYALDKTEKTFAYANRNEFKKGTSSYTSNKSTNNTNNNISYGASSNSNSGNAVLFKEDFQTADNNWYSNYNFKDSNYIYIATLDDPDNHYYLFRNRRYRQGYIVPIPFNSIPRSGYSIDISTKHVDGVQNSGYGLKFGASDWKNCYNFHITADGYYRIAKHEDDTYTTVVPWTNTSAIRTGSSDNKLEVRVYSSYTEFYVNGQRIRSLDMKPFGSKAGLEVYNNQTVYFDDLLIRSLGGVTVNNNYSNYSSDVLFREDFQTFDNNWFSNYNFKDSNYNYIATLDKPDNHYYLFRNRRYRGGYTVPVPFDDIPNAGYSISIDTRHFDGKEEFGYGIKFAASDWDNAFAFNISANGYYRVSKTARGDYSEIVPWTQTSLLNKGSLNNNLEVRVYLTYADLYINGKYATRISNFTRFGNRAALEVWNNQTIHYDNLLIKKL